MPQKVIFDTDIGSDVDDAFALAFLVNSPEVSIEAVTTVWGDARLRARLVKKQLNLLGRPDIPVAVGEDEPLNPERHSFLFGHEGHGAVEDNEELELSDMTAAEMIESLLRKYPGEIKVLLIGPQTNLGKLLTEKPELAELVQEFVVMGGLPFYGPKEMELFGERPVDYNFVTDPEAVRVVFECGRPITMIGTNVTMPTVIRSDQIERIGARRTPACDLLYGMTKRWLGVIDQGYTSMHDPLAVAAAFTLDYLETMMLNVTIETEGKITAGLTVVNRYDNEAWNTVRVATDAKREEFVEFMLERILA